jgi:hypothetical protein
VIASYVVAGDLDTVRAMNRRLEPDPEGTFLVERYWPGVDLEHLRDALPRLEAEARAMTAEGSRVEHVGSILMPVDQVVFSLITAADESLVRQLNERADLPVDRIAEAIALLAVSTPRAALDPAVPDPVPATDPRED